MREIIKNLRKYEIRIRKAINSQMQGDFHSIFKGSGLEFDDVRPYQWGDDVRSIDWRVSAKGHGTFVKTFIEEKEQTILFVIDVSASQEIGHEKRQKIDLAKEIAGVLTLSAIKESGKVGILCFSDHLELYVKPSKSLKHAYEIIKRLFSLKPTSKQTNLDECIKYTLNILNKKTVVFLISDFIDENYTHTLKGLGKKHDLVLIQVFDKNEKVMPKLGIVPLVEKESGKTIWLNTSSKKFKNIISRTYGEKKESLQDFCKRNDISHLSVGTNEDYAPKLIKLFRHRNRRNERKIV